MAYSFALGFSHKRHNSLVARQIFATACYSFEFTSLFHTNYTSDLEFLYVNKILNLLLAYIESSKTLNRYVIKHTATQIQL